MNYQIRKIETITKDIPIECLRCNKAHNLYISVFRLILENRILHYTVSSATMKIVFGVILFTKYVILSMKTTLLQLFWTYFKFISCFRETVWKIVIFLLTQGASLFYDFLLRNDWILNCWEVQQTKIGSSLLYWGLILTTVVWKD